MKPRGGLSKEQLAAIHLKLHKHKHIGFNNMALVIMNEKNPHTGHFYTHDEAEAIAGSIHAKQLAHKGKSIKKERK